MEGKLVLYIEIHQLRERKFRIGSTINNVGEEKSTELT